MKKTKKKLELDTETVRDLAPDEAPQVDGGTYYYPVKYRTYTCAPAPEPSACYADGCAQTGAR